MYSTDYDDTVVLEYGSVMYSSTDTWVGRIFPYVKNRDIFWDSLKPQPKGDIFTDYDGVQYQWQWVTNYSMNNEGYSRYYGGTSCQSMTLNVPSAQRSQTSFSDPSKRLAITPTRWAGLPFSWMRFTAYQAAWPTMDRYAGGWDWYQLVWDARREYSNLKFVGAFVDGHAAKYGKDKFVAYYADNSAATEASTYDQFCGVMDRRSLWDFWGKGWSGD